MSIKLIGYAPDIDPITPGTLIDCSAFISSTKGMQTAPSAVSANVGGLASACLGLVTYRKVDNTSRTIAGTATKLYELSGSTWNDVSGAAYGASATVRWSFAEFGNVTLAANKSDFVQASITGAFATVSGTAPKAAFIDTVNQFVFLANVNDGTDKTDGWACSALGDYTNYAPSTITQAANGRLTDTPGPFTGLRRLGDNIVLYKRRAVYVGVYTGPPIIWSFKLSSSDTGAVNNDTIASIDYMHYYMGEDDFYFFDGSRPVPFGQPIKETVYTELDRTQLHLCKSLVDQKRNRIYFYYPRSDGGGYANRCVVYNYRTQRWGRDDRSVEATGLYVSPGITYDGLGTLYSTYDGFPLAPYESAWLSSAVETPAIVDTSHMLNTLTGTPGTGFFRLGDYGDNFTYKTVTRMQCRFTVEPTSGSLTNYHKESSGAQYTEDQTVPLTKHRFDFLRAARWHSAKVTLTGPADMIEFDYEQVPAGEE